MPDSFNIADIERVSAEGQKIYESIKSQYEPNLNGKFLAIDIDTREVYLGKDGTEAVTKAKSEHPEKIFYLVKIGFESAEAAAALLRR